MSREWLIDKSALWKLPSAPHRQRWAERITAGQVRICLPTWLEAAYSSRNHDHFEQLRSHLLEGLVTELIHPDAEALARKVMGELIERSQHRSGSTLVADIMIASVAATARLTLLHDDTDFERIAAITGQPLQRLET